MSQVDATGVFAIVVTSHYLMVCYLVGLMRPDGIAIRHLTAWSPKLLAVSCLLLVVCVLMGATVTGVSAAALSCLMMVVTVLLPNALGYSSAA